MQVLIRPRPLQPSSTTLLYDLYVCENDECSIEKVHASEPSVSASLRAVELLSKGAAIIGLSDGSFIARDVGDDWHYDYHIGSDSVVGPPPPPYLIILDPLWGCGIRCPWCYAGPRRPKWDINCGRVAESLISGVKAVARTIFSQWRTSDYVSISVVVGGSSEPSVYTDCAIKLLEDAKKAILDVAKSMGRSTSPFTTRVYKAVTLGWPGATRRFMLHADEVVVTLYDYGMLSYHPLARHIGIDNYVDLVLDAVNAGASLAVIVTDSTQPIDVAEYVSNTNLRRLILLHYHPANPRLPFKPPSRDQILAIMWRVIDECGVTLDRISVDACTAIKIGARYSIIRELETTYMYRCTPYGCKTASSPCPRGGTFCVAAAKS